MNNSDNLSTTFEPMELCDRCPARPYARYEKNDGTLVFCRHHAIKHNVSLEKQGWKASYDFEGIQMLTKTTREMVSVD